MIIRQVQKNKANGLIFVSIPLKEKLNEGDYVYIRRIENES